MSNVELHRNKSVPFGYIPIFNCFIWFRFLTFIDKKKWRGAHFRGNLDADFRVQCSLRPIGSYWTNWRRSNSTRRLNPHTDTHTHTSGQTKEELPHGMDPTTPTADFQPTGWFTELEPARNRAGHVRHASNVSCRIYGRLHVEIDEKHETIDETNDSYRRFVRSKSSEYVTRKTIFKTLLKTFQNRMKFCGRISR